MSRINTNVPSLISARVLNTQQDTLTKSLERLSTGVRINRGADDPAGLIASESLRSERVAITAALGNATRAANVLSVAEGGLQEVNSLLLSLEDLVDRTASEAGLSADEVAANQLQIDSILDSINRVANSTEFNGRKLLDGTLAYTTSSINTANITDVHIDGALIPEGGKRNVVVQVVQSAQTGQLLFTGAGTTAANAVTLQIGGNLGTEVFSFAGSAHVSAIAFAINQSKALTGVSASPTAALSALRFYSTGFGTDQFVSVQAASGTFTVTGGSSSTRDEGRDATVLINGTSANAHGLDVSVQTTSLSLGLSLKSTFNTNGSSTTFAVTGGGANFAISPTVELAGRASIGIDSVTTGSLGASSLGFLSSLASGQTNELTTKNFSQAQRIIRAGIDQISSLRGRLGAFQRNTLDSTISSLNVALENSSAAESAIRDTDFAAETSKLTRSQILVQAATQVLQLSNSAPQAVLQLLR